MLNDRARTSGFLRAIRAVVRPGDVAVDIGTGTGVLAIAAARAGARHVYAIETGPIRRVAEQVIAANGLSDRITLIPGRSTKVRLPERADVLICELIGNEPLAERVLETTADAIRRLLRPKPRLVPRGIKIFGLPLSVPARERRNLTFTPESVRAWRQWYAMDLGSLAHVNRSSLLVHYIQPARVRGWRVLGPPLLLADIDFSIRAGPRVGHTSVFTADRSAVLSGLVVYFELRLSPTETLTTHPTAADKSNHWMNPLYVLVEPIRLRADDRVRVSYTYSTIEHREWVEVTPLD